MKIQMKLVSANDATLFEERLERILRNLPKDAVIADVTFSTCQVGEAVQYSALIHLQVTESWN
ncbi:MAG: hypothetical protein WD336_00605 [Trueperaceae bacterium]